MSAGQALFAALNAFFLKKLECRYIFGRVYDSFMSAFQILKDKKRKTDIVHTVIGRHIMCFLPLAQGRAHKKFLEYAKV